MKSRLFRLSALLAACAVTAAPAYAQEKVLRIAMTASDIPTTYPVVGRVANREAALIAAGHRFKPEKELRRLVEAAARMLETASEVPYGSLEISYMQTLPPKA